MLPIVPLLTAAMALWFGYRQLKKPKLPLPPGPPLHWLPFIGNAVQIMTAKVPFPCLLAEWREIYGDIYSFTVLGHTTIVVNTAADAKELFDMRSTTYNSRPSMPLLRDFLCKRANIAFEPYGDSWRRHRRAVHHELNVRDVNQYAHIQDREVRNRAFFAARD
jgi:cytochrome P450